MTTLPSGINLIHTYRHLLRHLLRAVQHSSPARYEARDRLRNAFRRPDGAASAPDPATVKRTLWFLDAAAREAGIEHRIVRNLLQVGWERTNSVKGVRSGTSAEDFEKLRDEGYRHYEMTIAMLNKTMGICLR